MNKHFILFLFCGLFFFAKAQKPIKTDPYGKVNQADLEMKVCDFEKDANAEILFDKGNLHPGDATGLVMERHTRIKIFNDFGKEAANVHIEVNGEVSPMFINDLEAETINFEAGKIEITKLDRKLVYIQKADKYRSTIVFALPNAKAGSIIEYKYKLQRGYGDWYFQSYLPVRYSEIQMDLPVSDANQQFKLVPHVKQPYVVNIGKADDYNQIKALADVHSLPNESYMGAIRDNLQRIEFLYSLTFIGTWEKIGKLLVNASDVGIEFTRNLTGEGAIINQAKNLKSNDEKIALIFDTVKNRMKWDETYRFFTKDGTVRAWDKKIGNSAEINIILFHLLKKAGINAYPMIVSTKKNGKINPYYPNAFLFNSLVVYIPVDTTKNYVLDATNKYNLYNNIPTDELNTYGFNLDESNKAYTTIFLENTEPTIQSVFLNAEIKAGGKMDGIAEITSFNYNKSNGIKKYKTDGEEKYINYLRNDDNNVKISAFKLENMDVDSLPLSQKFNFKLELNGSDENYIFFNTGLFNLMGPNPFMKEERSSDIDFGYRDNYLINGIYKTPSGYKAETLPKNMTIVMPDQSITFKRTIVQQDGTISARYVLNHKKTLYFRENYPDMRIFYKQLYELLNEQIVLKKI